jgi:uncharacterized protein involved in response to NO
MAQTVVLRRSRAPWTIFSYGFRPFFLGASLWAALSMALWIPFVSGIVVLPTAFDPVSWHAHEFLYGYLGAVIAGFLLTAIPNWTSRPPLIGWPLGLVFLLWVAGRVVMMFSMGLPPFAVAIVDLSLPVAIAVVAGNEILAGKNWRNLIILALLAAFILGNAIFHWEAARGNFAAHGYGLRIGLGVTVMMIAIIGGRIVPLFTRNWLTRRGGGRLPVLPMQTFDKVALLILLAALIAFVVRPAGTVTALALVLAGAAHTWRLIRWAGDRTVAEPLVWVLHIGYAFIPLGAFGLAGNVLVPDLITPSATQHLWMTGAIGTMTLAVMTRATLGHTGQNLAANAGTLCIYIALLAAVAMRLAAGIWIDHAMWLYACAGAAWFAAFGGFAVAYGPLLLRTKTPV